MAETPKQSPVNIDQNRAVGQDSPAEGSHMGREADKKTGYPGSPDIGTNAAQKAQVGEKLPPSKDRKGASTP
ncbi:hypothetical protein J2W32_001910 [Variovorax boronicumulans]|uniref:Uncharacterized protein n=3 Tax=Variovorax TaxID=34072 RepID=A0AAW8CUY3_9BURK|nr:MULTISPECIES: hypothetical protein [Variovorax]ADU37265.1 hypothetical protein Varpa_3078 [Variovorax paradoxus EPS]MDP9891691.1 hypothetical protein [Variovorax boronicumulans]MDQ0052864.1 hypothetical protein [Variovorax boronicumulans]